MTREPGWRAERETLEDREALVVRRMRRLIALTWVLGACVVALANLEVEVTARDYQTHFERAGSPALPFFVVVLLAPSIETFQRPRWPQLVVWILWFASWGILGFTVAPVTACQPSGSARSGCAHS